MPHACRDAAFVLSVVFTGSILIAAAGGPAAAAPDESEESGTEVAQVLPTPPPTTTPGAPAPEDAQELDTVIVTGTRVKGRSPTQSTSPIDAFGGAEFERQGTFDLTDELRSIAPSFNTQRYPISDGTAFIRPANLRNLPPDQTLVLINGHRRHRSALVNLQVEPFGTVNQGAQAVDFALIPAAAVDRIEVLRDGASAQYGSDAIAGVINVLLKQDPRGVTLSSQFGSTFAGDGDAYRFSANGGMPFLGGFMNLTGEIVRSHPTSRGSARPDAQTVANAVGVQNVPFEGLGQRWGDPAGEGVRLFLNTEFDYTDTVRGYGHGNLVRQDYVSSFFYRTPVGVAGVTPRGTLFVDVVPPDPDGTGPLPAGDGSPDDVDQAIVDALNAQGLDPDDFLTADATSPSGYVALNPIWPRFPGGYTPYFGAEILDYEAVVGMRIGPDTGLRWDVSGRYGVNEIDYTLENSINPSLGRLSPTTFSPGVLTQQETGINADFVYPITYGPNSLLNLAWGLEHRTETYEIGVGDVASWQASPTGVLFGVGSDGFQGDPPQAAGTFDRSSYAGYFDVETDFTRHATLGAAVRLEDSDEYDASFDWKLAGRWNVVEPFAVRATVSTGFRAPTPGQINTLDVTTTADASGALVPLGTFPVNSRAARALGATPLDPEESLNTTVGFVLTPLRDVSLTVDLYRIEVEDRIALANISIAPGSPEEQALIDAGVENATLLRSVSFFTNAFDTTVQGIEGALTGRTGLGGAGHLTADLRHSYNEQTVDRVKSGTIDAERVFDLENQLPRNRTALGLTYQTPQLFETLLRINHYGSWQDTTFGEVAQFGDKWIVDLVATFALPAGARLSLGGENIFDTYPDRETNSVLTFLGATRPLSSPFGINGGLWFLRLAAEFR